MVTTRMLDCEANNVRHTEIMSSPGRRRRGRPAQLSREQIVEAALELLRREPARPLTMQRLASALNTAPMSLYTHIRNREDLLQAIASEILGGVPLPSADGPWQDTVRAWAGALRQRFLAYPFVGSLLQEGIATPAAWLELSNPLLQALQQAGLRGAALADAQRWVSRVVIGSVLMELAVPAAVPAEFASVARALGELPEASQGVWREVLPELGRHDDDAVFAYTLDRTLVALQALVEGA